MHHWNAPNEKFRVHTELELLILTFFFTDLAAEDGLLSGPPFAPFTDILARR